MDYPTSSDEVDAATARQVETWATYLAPPETAEQWALFGRLTARRRTNQQLEREQVNAHA